MTSYFFRLIYGTLILLFITSSSQLLAQKNTPPTMHEAEVRRRIGQKALENGRHKQAKNFLLQALALKPNDLEIIGELLQTEGLDPESIALWIHYAVPASATKGGKFRTPKSWPKIDSTPIRNAKKLLKLRSQAIQELAKTVARLKGGKKSSLLRYLNSLKTELSLEAPALGKSVEGAFEKATNRCKPASEKVIKALNKLMQQASTDKQHAVALSIAQTLRGLNQQKNQEPGSSASQKQEIPKVLNILNQSRKALQEGEKVYTLSELKKVPEIEHNEWSNKHNSWASPGVSISPGGRYRLETICGIETLLVATMDIEFHHNRLVAWYGQDPFKERQGLVRLCRSSTDMEVAGQPFWWAGGFQSGDITTVQASYSSRHGLKGVLTHELTHRFDGTIYPGLPSWLSEGRAVYTETCTVDPHSPELDPRRISFGKFWEANSKGYGGQRKIESLLRGTIEDYRDNYHAGYSLWICLLRFQNFEDAQQGKAIFAPKLDAYLQSFRKNSKLDPVERFKLFFLDGKEGRPKDLKEFSKIFGKFLHDGAIPDAPPWRKVWQNASNEAQRSSAVRTKGFPINDRAAWARNRSRSDPVAHGEEHAYQAGLILKAQKRYKSALDAFEWALQVDEPRAERLSNISQLSKQEGAKAAAWVQELEAFRLDASHYKAPEDSAPSELSKIWRKTKLLCDELVLQEEAARTANQHRLARALRADHNRLAKCLGIPELSELPKLDATKLSEKQPPDCFPFINELVAGVEVARWSPMESHLHKLWYMPTEAELEMGRKKNKGTVSGALRDAGVRRVFARGNTYHTGTYTFRTKIRFISAHVTANLVIGYTRQDRGVKISFGGGDYSYAVGKTEEALTLKGVNIGIDDLRPFDRSATTLHRYFSFERPREFFTLTVVVDGPYLKVRINNQDALIHRRSTNDPIEGYIGYALGSGLVRFEDPETRHHRILGPEHTCPCEQHDESINLENPLSFPWSSCVGRRVEGIAPNESGTILIWYSAATLEKDRSTASIEDYIERIKTRVASAKLPTNICLALPPPLPSGKVDFERGNSFGLPGFNVYTHAGSPNLIKHLNELVKKFATQSSRNKGKPSESDLQRERSHYFGGPTWLVLDENNIVRACGTWGSFKQAITLSHHLTGW